MRVGLGFILPELFLGTHDSRKNIINLPFKAGFAPV